MKVYAALRGVLTNRCLWCEDRCQIHLTFSHSIYVLLLPPDYTVTYLCGVDVSLLNVSIGWPRHCRRFRFPQSSWSRQFWQGHARCVLVFRRSPCVLVSCACRFSLWRISTPLEVSWPMLDSLHCLVSRRSVLFPFVGRVINNSKSSLVLMASAPVSCALFD